MMDLLFESDFVSVPRSLAMVNLPSGRETRQNKNASESACISVVGEKMRRCASNLLASAGSISSGSSPIRR